VTCGNFRRGFGFEDTFNPNTTTVISPWSNPNTNIWGDPYPVVITFAMEIIGQYEEIINVHFYLSNPEDAKPSRPQNFTTVMLNSHPHLTWDANGEPDLWRYRIYKKLELWEGGIDTFEIDVEPKYPDPEEWDDEWFTSGKPYDKATYWICAVDTQGKLSDKTDSYSFLGISLIQWKQVVNIDELPREFFLYNNYPNPFNPTTTIKYDLPEESFVKLRIFNLLGEDIRTLVVGKESAGFKNMLWNGKDNRGNLVSSGMYIYNLSAKSLESGKEFHQTRKMVLLR